MLDIDSIETLEDRLSEPCPGTVDTLRRLQGDILVLGAAGKMGPSLTRMIRRGSDLAGVKRRVVAVSRFSSAGSEEGFHRHGIETIRCDLLDPAQLAALPDCPNVVLMTGMKFGTTGNEHLTWAMNCLLPADVGRRFRGCRMVAFSTGNVYGLSAVARGGSVESDVLRPVGEYALSALGRERMYEHASRTCGIAMSIIRLNYAVELRYGVPVDIARKVWANEPIDLGMGCFNAIWQGDANAMSIRAFDLAATPPCVVNVTGPETLSVRAVAQELGRLMGRAPVFTGAEGTDALLSNAGRAFARFGYPRVAMSRLLVEIARWVASGGTNLDKPTHFESRDGKF